MTRKIHKHSGLYTYKGETLSVRLFYEKYKPEMSLKTFKNRVINGCWSIERALTTPAKASRASKQPENWKRKVINGIFHYPFNGEYLTLKEVAEITGTSRFTLQSRVECALHGDNQYATFEELATTFSKRGKSGGYEKREDDPIADEFNLLYQQAMKAFKPYRSDEV